jgi:D-aminoacyl-tRNA deacylase
MIGLLQRVSAASVSVDGTVVGAVCAGLCVLVGVERGDAEPQAVRLLERILGYRVFPDASVDRAGQAGRMERSLSDTGGGLLLVPQFTLAADTRKGMRASFTPAAAPADGARLFEQLVALAQAAHGAERVATGRFGAHMAVELVNDGPVTFWLQARA